MKRNLFSVMALVVPLIGFVACKEAPKSRYLKKKVELGRIQSREFTLPGGEQFNFEFVINAQAYEVVGKSPDFILPYAGPTVFSTLSAGDQNLLGDDQVELFGVKKNIPVCVQEYPNMKIGGAVNGFEFTNGIGVKFGYNKDGDYGGVGGEAKVKVDISELDLTLNGYDPLSKMMLASANVSPNETRTKIGLDIDFKEFNLGPEFFFKSALSGVTRKGLEQSLSKLAEATRKYQWFAQVLEDQDAYVVFNAGSRSGIVQGDKFQVHNLEHFWSGTPCSTSYQGNVPTTQEPILVVEAAMVGDDLTKARVLSRMPDEGAVKGSRVTIKELVAPK